MRFILCFLLIPLIGFCQNSDSLNFENSKLADTIRIKAGNQIISNLLKQNDSLAIYYINKAEKLCGAKNNNLLGEILISKGAYFILYTDYAEALKALYKAELLLKSINKNNEKLFHAYSSFGQLYLNDDKYELSVNYLNKAIDILNAQTKLDTLSYIKANYTLGSTYSAWHKNDVALQYYLKAHNMALKFGNAYALSATNSGLASVYKNIGTNNNDTTFIKKCIPYAYNSVKMLTELNLESKLPYSLNILGYAYDQLHQLDSAIKYQKLALGYFEKFQVLPKMKTTYKALGYCYAQKSDFKNCYTYLDKYIDITDTLYNQERRAEIDGLSAKFETEKKETEIKNLEQQQLIIELQSKRKTILIYSICGFIILIALVTYFIFTRYKTKKHNELLRIQLEEANKTVEAEKKAAESELKALKSQMNPHFIFNALNSIQEQFMYGDKIKANEQMGNFTYLTRQILNVSSKNKITLATEIDIITKYLDLEKMRFSTDFNYEISYDKNIDEDYHELPPMLIQPFIENSMKHGLLHKIGEKKININFALDDKEEYIICTIIDNGIGRKKAAEIKMNNQNIHSSFSINSIEERLQLLNKELQLKQLIIYSDELDKDQKCIGTKVIMLIPIL